ncbi:MAG: polyketide synthase dehydratase domain-containing protein, partial [bacterium]
PVFRDAIDAICDAIDPHLDRPLRAVMFADDGTAEAALLDRTDFTQAALFAFEVALYRLWHHLGLRPDALLGHSIGELVAAHVAGALSLADAAKLVAARGRLMAALPAGGVMVAVEASAAEVEPLLGAGVCLAAVNGPRAVVLSGDAEAVEAAAAKLTAAGRRVRALVVSHAFHSHHLDPMLDDLRAAAAGLTVGEPQIPIVGNETGAVLTRAALADPDHWVRQARRAVRFGDGITTLARDGITTFVELGPRGALCAMAPANLPDDSAAMFVPSLRAGRPEPAALVEALGAAWAAKVAVDWAAFFAPRATRHVELPTYAFQRRRYWLDAPIAGDAAAMGQAAADHPLLAAAVELPGGGLVLTGRLSLAGAPWLADHRVAGQVLVPGTAFVELALHAADRVGAAGIVELLLIAPLVLGPAAAVALRVGVEPAAEGWTVTIHSRPDDAGEAAPWTLHAEGRLGEPGPGEAVDFTTWPPAGAEAVALDGFYARLAGIGFEYGPLFQGLTRLWRAGEVVWAEVAQPALTDATRYGLHPALFDAAWHGSSLIEDDVLALPFAWRGVRCDRVGASSLRARLTAVGDAVALALADGTGAPVGRVEALQSRPVDAAALASASAAPGRGAVHRIEWDEGIDADAIRLDDWAVVGDGFAAIPQRLAAPLDAARLPAPLAGVLVTLPPGEVEPASIRRATADALALLQRWLAEPRLVSTRLVFVTRGAVAVDDGERVDDLGHAALWGLVGSAHAEHPERGLAVLDIDGDPAPDVLARALAVAEPWARSARGGGGRRGGARGRRRARCGSPPSGGGGSSRPRRGASTRSRSAPSTAPRRPRASSSSRCEPPGSTSATCSWRSACTPAPTRRRAASSRASCWRWAPASTGWRPARG